MRPYCKACKHFFVLAEYGIGGGQCHNPSLEGLDRVKGPYTPWVGSGSGVDTLKKCDEIGGFEKR